MARTNTFASLAILAAVAAFPLTAQAQAPPTERTSTLPKQIGNVVGGGSATLAGGSDDMRITYSAGGAGGGGVSPVQSGRLATFAGTDGDGPRWNYGALTTDGNGGREAWLTGGGDNAQVVYSDPAPARRR